MNRIIRFSCLLALLCIATILVADAGQATSGRALRIVDYYSVLTIGSAAFSADGQWITYTVSRRVEDDNCRRGEGAERVGERALCKPRAALIVSYRPTRPAGSIAV